MPKPNTSGTACDQTMVNASANTCGKEYVEIYNTDPCNAVDISCYIIASKTQNGNIAAGTFIGGSFAFPAGTIIPPLGHIVVGGPNASATAGSVDFILANYIGQPNLCIESTRWFLENTAGWIALYKPTGAVEDAIYWTFSAGNPNLLTSDAEFSFNPCKPTSCGALPTLKSAKQMTVGTEITYVQDVTSANLTFSRIPDGGAWQRNIAPSIAGTNNCNGGTCNTATLISFNAVVTQPTCGNNNGSISLTVTTAGAVTFSWSPNPSPTNTATATSASNLAANTYTISVTQNGCTKDTSITLSPTGKPNAGSNQTGICAGTSTTLTGTTPTTGTWSVQTGNPAGATLGTTTGGIASVAFSANASGIYNFIYTANGCTDTMNVTVNPKPNAGANQTGICAGTSTTLTGTTPTTGTWTAQTGNPAGATLGTTTGGVASVSFTTNASGIYNFIYTANGCSDTMNVTVTAKPNAGVDQSVSCFSSGSATMAASGTGTWTIGAGSAGTATITTSGSPTTTVTGFSASGNYFLVWTNNGCSDTSRITANNTCGCTDSLTLSMSKVDNTNCSPSTCSYTGPAVVINELLIDKSGENTILARSNLSAGSEWVELYNPNPCQALDLSCYMLGNYSNENGGAVSEPAVLFFPPGTTIPPLGFLTIGGANSGADRLPTANLPGFIGNRLYLPGGIFEGGWIGIWNSTGTIVDAVYWMDNSRNINSTVATASFTTSPGTITNANVPFSCPYRGTLQTARAIANAAGPITRIGGIAQDSKFAFRNIDAGTVWTFNGNTGTQGACNATCATPNPPSCNGTATATVTAGAPGPYTYEWDAAAGNQSTQTAINLCAGTYCVTVKNTAGNWCKTQCITVNTIKPNAGINQSTCAGTSATLTGTNPTTGAWTAQTGNPAGATLGTTTGGIASVSFASSASGIYNF
ncbi:MAG: lamin tail domain-containing protein [Saprospirales bacterium]|nr:lamin tail domain-containing protein [Saprospirales bacterium]